jgi:hypothetical protein
MRLTQQKAPAIERWGRLPVGRYRGHHTDLVTQSTANKGPETMAGLTTLCAERVSARVRVLLGVTYSRQLCNAEEHQIEGSRCWCRKFLQLLDLGMGDAGLEPATPSVSKRPLVPDDPSGSPLAAEFIAICERLQSHIIAAKNNHEMILPGSLGSTVVPWISTTLVASHSGRNEVAKDATAGGN